MKNIKIEPARAEDIKVMAKLLSILFGHESEFSADTAKQEKGLKCILENPDAGRILVLKENEVVVGMVSLLFSISTALGGKVAILEDMIISPDKRGLGYGGRLLDEAIKWARENGYLRITLLTDVDNEKAIAFYKTRDFKNSPMIPLRLVF